MKNLIKYIVAVIFIGLPFFSFANDGTTKKERNYITHGNEEYNNGNYQKAIQQYEEALKLNPGSQVAEFNIASALVNLPESKDLESKALQRAIKIFTNLSTSSSSNIAQKSLFNLGHIAYNQKKYQQSIDFYKKVLRNDPRNDRARKYLRMAQLQQQNQDKKDNQEEEKEKNKEEQKQDKKEKNKDSNKEEQENSQQNKNQPSSPQQLNDANAEKILKSIENKEQETLLRIKKRAIDAKRTDKEANGSFTDKPW